MSQAGRVVPFDAEHQRVLRLRQPCRPRRPYLGGARHRRHIKDARAWLVHLPACENELQIGPRLREECQLARYPARLIGYFARPEMHAVQFEAHSGAPPTNDRSRLLRSVLSEEKERRSTAELSAAAPESRILDPRRPMWEHCDSDASGRQITRNSHDLGVATVGGRRERNRGDDNLPLRAVLAVAGEALARPGLAGISRRPAASLCRSQ